MKLGDRLDGHIVLGHVDCVGRVKGFERAGESAVLAVSAPGVSWGLMPKGSVAIDGVSLTVIDSSDDLFTAGLIPTTMRDTTIGLLAEGGEVNVEIDVIARYVAGLLRSGSNGSGHAGGGLTWEKLSEYGWT
jgi:riboflavin synthase